MHRALALLFVFVLGARCASCDSRPIVRIDVVDRSDSRPPSLGVLDTKALERSVAARISMLEGFAFRHAREGEEAFQIAVDILLVAERTSDADPALKHRAVGLRATLKAIGPSAVAPNDVVVETLLARDVAPSMAFAAFFDEAISEAMGQLHVAVGLSRASPEEVGRALESSDARVRSRAIIVAGERKLGALVPRLVRIVRDEAEVPDVVLGAVGALVAIGDRAAVPAIIDAASRRPRELLPQIFFALGLLGGREAEAYLFTMESGHPDPDMRRNAGDALRELRRAEKPKDQ